MHKITKIILLFLMLFSDSAICADEKYLKLMGEAYLELNYYSDKGTIVNYYVAKGPDVGSFSKFTTNYKRPNKLKFDWIKTNPISGKEKISSIINDGSYLSVNHPDRAPREETSYTSALSSLAGLSSSASYLTPFFLEYGYLDEQLEKIKNVQYIGEELTNNHLCDVIKVKYKHGSIETLWLDKNTHLIWRYEYLFNSELDKQDIQTIIEYTSIDAKW